LLKLKCIIFAGSLLHLKWGLPCFNTLFFTFVTMNRSCIMVVVALSHETIML